MMNFTTISTQDSNYNQVMMRKHLDMKRQLQQQKKQETLYKENNNIPKHKSQSRNTHRILHPQNLSWAGKTLISPPPSPGTLPNISPSSSVNQHSLQMRKLLEEGLKSGLQEYETRQREKQEQEGKIKKVMSIENGVMDYMEREIHRRDDFISRCLKAQDNRACCFVDEPRRRHVNALQHIQRNYDADIFNHSSDKYQQAQKQHFEEMVQQNSKQSWEKREARVRERQQYGTYFDESYAKRMKESEVGKQKKDVLEMHNPITNPIEYHVENPYFVRQMRRLP